MRDIGADGAQAWRDGKSRADCPYREDYDGGDYWASPAGMRQRWLGGYNRASVNDEIVGKKTRLPWPERQPE